MKNIAFAYHNIVDGGQLKLYDVQLADFIAQMDAVAAHARQGLAPEVLITFDDGYRSWAHEVLDVLRARKLTAWFFVSLQFIAEGKISKDDVRTLAGQGMRIGSHGVDHSTLNVVDWDNIHYELEHSKKVLEDITGKPVDAFSVPRGVYSRRMLLAARAAGYTQIFTSNVGLNDGMRPYMKRIAVQRNTSPAVFERLIRGKGITALRARHSLLHAAKAILGVRAYTALRNKFIPRAEG